MHVCFFFFNDTATTEIYTLSLHDALPICRRAGRGERRGRRPARAAARRALLRGGGYRRWRRRGRRCARLSRARCGRACRSEEHTSELQSRQYLVCRLLLEKKKICIMMDKI